MCDCNSLFKENQPYHRTNNIYCFVYFKLCRKSQIKFVCRLWFSWSRCFGGAICTTTFERLFFTYCMCLVLEQFIISEKLYDCISYRFRPTYYYWPKASFDYLNLSHLNRTDKRFSHGEFINTLYDKRNLQLLKALII